MHKKGHQLKTSPLIKNPQFSSNLADIQAKLPTHEVVILTKFYKDYKKIVDFLLTQKFLVCALFYASPFIWALSYCTRCKINAIVIMSNRYIFVLQVCVFIYLFISFRRLCYTINLLAYSHYPCNNSPYSYITINLQNENFVNYGNT